MKVIRAVIFDCFGVLTADGWISFQKQYFDTNPELLKEAKAYSRLVNLGSMDYLDFAMWLSRKTGASLKEVKRALEGSVPNKELFDYIKEYLKPKYKIGMLSNAAINVLDSIFEPWQANLFDGVVLSYEVGVAKPDKLAYHAICEKLAASFDEAVFIDDSGIFVEAAKSLGMRGVWYQGFDKMRSDLEGVLNA